MTDKEPLPKNGDSENGSSGNEKSNDQPALKVPNPFEQSIEEIPQETLDSIEQFKEAQTERD